jgi:hypothetical protein
MKTSNRLLAASLALVLAAGVLSARTTPPISDLGRQDLMGPWLVAAVPNDPKQADILSVETATWTRVNAPFLLTRLPGLDAKTAEAVHYSWARREFVAPAETAFRNAVLHLHGVRWGSKIWLNGKEVGSHLGAYGAFEFDLADALQWGQTNTLLLRLTGWPEIPRSHSDDPTHVGAFPLIPHGAACFGWGNRQAGISGALWIDYFDHARLQDVQILTDIPSGQVVVRGGMRNFARQFGQRWIEPTIVAPDGTAYRGARVEVPWPNTAFRRVVFEFTTEMKIRKPQRWSPDQPALYRLQLDLVQEGATLSRWSENFGFRSFEARSAVPPANGGFFLNNERVFLRGICTVGQPHLFAAPAERPGLLRRMLVDAPKAANLNCIRNHTVPLDGEALDVMDRYGMMLLQEFPITINYRNPSLTPAEREAYHEQCLKEFRSLLPLYWNHPSIVIWVPSNESWFDTDWENGPLCRLFQDADPSRPVMRTGEQSPDIFDTHCYDGFWAGPEGKFELAVAAAAVRGRATGKPLTNTEYIENLRVAKWMGDKPDDVTDEEWASRRQDVNAQFILEETESLRRLGYDGTLPYMWGRGYVTNLDTTNEPPAFTPAFHALRSGQAPVLASLALADRHFMTGQRVRVPIVLCDDTGARRRHAVNILLVSGDPGFTWPSDRPGVTVVWQKQVTAAAKEGSGPLAVPCPMPAQAGRYYLLAVVQPDAGRAGNAPAVSRRVIDVVAPVAPARLAGRTIALFAGDRLMKELGVLCPGAKILAATRANLPGADVLLIAPKVHARIDELTALQDAIEKYLAVGGRVVVLDQDRSLLPLGLEIPRVDGLGGASTVFRAGPAEFIAWRGLGADSRLLRRFNGPTGALVRLPLAPRPGDDTLAVAAQEGQTLNWPAMARRAVGQGEWIFCQLVIADHLAGDHADPVAQAILVNVLADGK